MRYRRVIGLMLVAILVLTGCKNVGKENEQEPTVTPSPFVETPEPTEGPVEDTTIPSDKILDEVHEAVMKQLGDDYVANMPYDSVAVNELFGVQPQWYDAGIAEGPMMSANIDKFLAFHATEGNLGNIEGALKKYRESIIADTMQYPMNQLKTQGCMVQTIDGYVFLVMLGFIDETAYEKDEKMIEAYMKINETVLDSVRDIIMKK